MKKFNNFIKKKRRREKSSFKPCRRKHFQYFIHINTFNDFFDRDVKYEQFLARHVSHKEMY